jgi:hypothetical protein
VYFSISGLVIQETLQRELSRGIGFCRFPLSLPIPGTEQGRGKAQPLVFQEDCSVYIREGYCPKAEIPSLKPDFPIPGSDLDIRADGIGP